MSCPSTIPCCYEEQTAIFEKRPFGTVISDSGSSPARDLLNIIRSLSPSPYLDISSIPKPSTSTSYTIRTSTPITISSPQHTNSHPHYAPSPPPVPNLPIHPPPHSPRPTPPSRAGPTSVTGGSAGTRPRLRQAPSSPPDRRARDHLRPLGSQRGAAAVAQIERDTGVRGVVQAWTLDLGDFESVKAFAGRGRAGSWRGFDAVVGNCERCAGSVECGRGGWRRRWRLMCLGLFFAGVDGVS
jgi:hypothetical protein